MNVEKVLKESFNFSKFNTASNTIVQTFVLSPLESNTEKENLIKQNIKVEAINKESMYKNFLIKVPEDGYREAFSTKKKSFNQELEILKEIKHTKKLDQRIFNSQIEFVEKKLNFNFIENNSKILLEQTLEIINEVDANLKKNKEFSFFENVSIGDNSKEVSLNQNINMQTEGYKSSSKIIEQKLFKDFEKNKKLYLNQNIKIPEESIGDTKQISFNQKMEILKEKKVSKILDFALKIENYFGKKVETSLEQNIQGPIEIARVINQKLFLQEIDKGDPYIESQKTKDFIFYQNVEITPEVIKTKEQTMQITFIKEKIKNLERTLEFKFNILNTKVKKYKSLIQNFDIEVPIEFKKSIEFVERIPVVKNSKILKNTFDMNVSIGEYDIYPGEIKFDLPEALEERIAFLEQKCEEMESYIMKKINAPLDWYSDEKDINIPFEMYRDCNPEDIEIKCYNLKENLEVIVRNNEVKKIMNNIFSWSTESFYVKPFVPINLLIVAVNKITGDKTSSILQCKQRTTVKEITESTSITGKLIW